MTTTRSRLTEDSWREIEIQIQEVSVTCHKQIEKTTSAMESKIINKIDQLVSLVTNCDAKIEIYNSTMEDRIQTKVGGIL